MVSRGEGKKGRCEDVGDLVALLLLDGWGGDGGKGCALVVGREVRLVSYVQGGY